MINNTHTSPWYRQFWPWFVLALPATAVIAGITTVIIAMQTDDTLVADDYYKQGLAINQNLKREHKARSMGLQAMIHISQQGALQVQMRARQPLPVWPALTIRLTHPTLASQDKTLTALVNQRGNYQVELLSITPGRWYIKLEAPGQDWQLNGTIQIREQGDTQATLNMDAG